MNKKIALYGGAFDPPHIGHTLVINALLNSNLVDEVWIVPTGARKDKAQSISTKHRMAMIKLMLSSTFKNQKVFLNSVQLEEKLPGSTTFDLINYVKKRHPKVKFFFVVGADLVGHIHKWKEGKLLITKENLILVPRFDLALSKKIPRFLKAIKKVKWFKTGISSTTVRRLLKKNKCVNGLITQEVLSYIQKNNLYR